MSPLLSICIPAYNRPHGLARALRSVAIDAAQVVAEMEIVVTDDSTTDDCEAVVQTLLGNWPGAWQYVRNAQRLGMTGNWNQAIRLASGQYVLVLHDDDFLLPGGPNNVVETLQQLTSRYKTLLFGVQVLNDQGKLLRAQIPHCSEWLPPPKAVYNLLANSSFIRFPGMVIQRELFQELGGFQAEFGGAADLEMWLRLLQQEGLFCVKQPISAYTVHSGALTMEMFNSQTIQYLHQIFEKAAQTNLLTSQQLSLIKSDFFHQFILAGTFRYLRRKRYAEAIQTMQLFGCSELSDLRYSQKWLPPRVTFSIISSGLSVAINFIAMHILKQKKQS